MKPISLLVTALSLLTSVEAQNTEFKFDFGAARVATGYTRITQANRFTEAVGYGFDFGTDTTVQNAQRKSKNALAADGIASKNACYFSMNVPEGNYKISITLGSLVKGKPTTIKAESRRLMMENIITKPGKLKTVTFVVNIKNLIISNGVKVSLKPHEFEKLDWDDKLTLEFNGPTIVTAMEVQKVEDQVTVFLAGNSTVVNQEFEPWASWGQMIPRFFKPGVAFSNHAESGLTLGSFLSSRRLQKILSIGKPGDYLFVEFGHNDQKEKGANDGAWKSYTERLKLFISEARKKQMIPVIVTSTARRNFDSTGKNINNLGEYPDAARKVARDEGVALIDLNAMSHKLYEALGVEQSKKAFVFYPANTYPGQKEELKDNTHFNTYGAYQLAKCIVQGIRANKLAISKLIVKGMPNYDPAKPENVQTFYWPETARNSVIKPDGN